MNAIGKMFGGSTKPPPAPPPAPTADDAAKLADQMAADEAKRLRGRASTQLTAGMGDLSAAPVASKTLYGS